MKKTVNYSEKIQQYLANELSGKELAEFEMLIKTKPELQDEISLYRKVSDAITDSGLEDFKNRLDKIHYKNYSSILNFNNKNQKQWYMVAALIVILITAGSLFWFSDENKDPNKLFDEYYEPIEASVSRSCGIEDIFARGINAYTQKKFDISLALFEKVVKLDETNYAARLYLGISNMETGKLKNAILQFKSIIQAKDPFYIQEAEWYTGLSLLKMEKIDESISVFAGIVERNGVYAERASLILDKLH